MACHVHITSKFHLISLSQAALLLLGSLFWLCLTTDHSEIKNPTKQSNASKPLNPATLGPLKIAVTFSLSQPNCNFREKSLCFDCFSCLSLRKTVQEQIQVLLLVHEIFILLHFYSIIVVRQLPLFILAALDNMSTLHILTSISSRSHEHLMTKNPVATCLIAAPNLILKRKNHFL